MRISVRPQQVGDLVAVALRLSLRPAVLDDDVLPLDIAQLPEARPESVEVLPGHSRRVDKDDSYSGNLPRPLRPGSERRSDGTSARGQQEAAAVHVGMVGQTPVRSQRRDSRSVPDWCHRNRDIDVVGESPDTHAMLLAELVDFVTRHRPCGQLTGRRH